MTSPVHILFTNHLNEEITANSLTIPGLTPVLNGIDAIVTIDIPITNLQEAFYFKTDSLIATDATDDVRCYVDTSKWATMVNDINASTGTISVANNAFVDSDIISKDFLRNVANGLFGTHLGVDLFTNETTVAQNLVAQTLTVANSIKSIMDDVGIAGTDGDLNVDASGNKYFLDTVTGTKNVTRSLLLQLLAAAPERFHSSNFGSYQLSGEPGSYRMPLNIGDSLSYALTIHPDPNQNTSVNTGTNAESRKYRVKLVMTDPPTSSEILIDASAWIGNKSVHDATLTMASFITYCQNLGVTVTTNNISNNNTSSQYPFPDGNGGSEKTLKFWKGHSQSSYIEFTAPITGTCEIKYGNSYQESRLYLNDTAPFNPNDANNSHFHSIVGGVDPGINYGGTTYAHKTTSFAVNAGDKIRVLEYVLSVSYLFYIKFT